MTHVATTATQPYNAAARSRNARQFTVGEMVDRPGLAGEGESLAGAASDNRTAGDAAGSAGDDLRPGSEGGPADGDGRSLFSDVHGDGYAALTATGAVVFGFCWFILFLSVITK